MKNILSVVLFVCAATAFAHDHGGANKASVGADKGVVAADPKSGFVLQKSAEQNFAIKITVLDAGPLWLVPRAALVYSGLETQIFRRRGDHWRSVDVEVVRKRAELVEIRSQDLRRGDAIAVKGGGFLKIIEQSVFGPVHDEHED
jgi:hypothetical protein